ncbi:hypothetical protein Nepgr_017666 [Nepenthes gracilis]|uniref:Uncharacterized protein n=1 Tax=Nepenthes gracilis TaxID=150966 RepID=A0AAD3XTK9_NEPGR|nr:hypothetical protein Nepgr_017666 [Nepenthes gracilis]
MATCAAAAARSIIRSASFTRTATSRVVANCKPKRKPSTPAPFQFCKRNPLSHCRIFRSPVELSCCVDSMLSYHTAAASALLTSVLSVWPYHYGWTLEDG